MVKLHGSNERITKQNLALGRLIRKFALLCGDTIILQVAIYLALLARFDGSIPMQYYQAYIRICPAYTLGTLLIFEWRGLYRSLWRYAGLVELYNVLIATSVTAVWLYILSYLNPLPRFALLLQWFILVVLISLWRLALRAVRRLLIANANIDKRSSITPNQSNVLIVGARGPGADLVLPLIQAGRRVVGLVDDDPEKINMRIHGIRVLGSINEVSDIVSRYGVQEVLLALLPEQKHMQKDIIDALAGTSVTLRTIPSVNELIDGRVAVSQIRPISIEDLLGREPVRLNLEVIAESIRDEVVLVTGAGGSIGSELCRQVCSFNPALLVMLGHGENSIFEAGLDLNQRYPCIPKAQVIADVRDRAKIDVVFAQYRPTLVFHAAADKHVHFMEEFPEEAVKTNVFGTQNVATAACKYGVKKFVMISTDKAVNPTSVMGCSKRVAEMVVQDLNSVGRTRFMSVRFGNVLGSRGSVVPVFQRQIAAGGPVTVTDPEMRRYFMTIPEAVQLVLQASTMGQGGEVFVLDMGEPMKIVDLARNMIMLSGFRPDIDIQIRFTGRRPGEKLYEELLLVEEGTSMTAHSRIFTSKNLRMQHNDLAQKLVELEQAVFGNEVENIIDLLKSLVPAYTPYSPVAVLEAAAASDSNT